MSDNNYMHLGEEAEADDVQAAGKAPIQFDPAKALEEAGIPVPQEIELAPEPEVDEIAVLAQEAVARNETEVLHPTDHDQRDGDWSAFRTWRDDAALAQLDRPDHIQIGPIEPEIPADLQIGVLDSGNPKDAIGNTKPDLSLVPPAAVLLTAHAFTDGAKKYGPYNWREKKVKARVYVAAAQRHIAQFLDGEDTDPISGVDHIGHALACLAIIADAKSVGNLIDDRPLPGASGKMIRQFGDTGSFQDK